MKNRTAYLGVLTGLALILGYLESLIPIIAGIPGIKLGLANLVVILAIYELGYKEAFLLSVTRIFLSGFLFGNLAMILYSLAGGMLSLGIMEAAKKNGRFSVCGISIFGGVFHNIGQLAMAAVLVENTAVFHYFPVLCISGVVMGFLVGFLAVEVQRRIRWRGGEK